MTMSEPKRLKPGRTRTTLLFGTNGTIKIPLSFGSGGF